VQFTVATNPGTPPADPRASRRAASCRASAGAEVCLAKVGDAATIVFDGRLLHRRRHRGGGRRASAPGEGRQVLVVTHSPQVAAVADRHWLIRKTTSRNAASTDVLALDAKVRREEIARMLSGAEVTAEARAAADRLLAAAG
jgi:DNA repair protein RecN (Recombination protein N)